MNLYFLDRTPLAALGRLARPPQSGDVVVYLRPGQDPEGKWTGRLADGNIQALWGEAMLNPETSHQIDRTGSRFMDGWYFADGRDVTRVGDISFGKLLDWEIGRLVLPAYVIRTGEILRLALEKFAAAETVYFDLTDGEGMDRVRPEYRPLGELAEYVATALGRESRRLEPADPLPPLILREFEVSLARLCKSFVGGFRLDWLASRLKMFAARFRKDTRPVFYVFIGRGTELLVRELADSGKFRLCVNRIGIEGTQALRYDHLPALPGLAEIRTARATLKHLAGIGRAAAGPDLASLNGIDYGPLLARAAAAVAGALLWKNLVIMAQARKLQRVSGFSALLINGEAGFLMGALADMNRNSGIPIYYVGHGMNTFRSPSFGMGFNSPHVTYIASGTDHQAEYGGQLPEHRKPRRPALGNPLTGQMNPVRGKRPACHGKRLLILGCGFPGHATASRSRSSERHLLDVFMVFRELAEQGWSATYRGHPHHTHRLEKQLARSLGVFDLINWDGNGDINETLVQHDVAVTAFSSVFYQTLYAGWPTIYYDPIFLEGGSRENQFADDLFVGLPAAGDIDWPLATDREGLARLIRESLDPDSSTSVFPERFATDYAERFIGPNPAAAEAAIARFIIDEAA